MALEHNKKMLILYVLQILKEHSDESHLLTQKEIAEKIYKKYLMQCDRKSVAANIDSLIDFGYDIQKSSKGCFLGEREIEPCELRFLIDCISSTKQINYLNQSRLIKKLLKFNSKHFSFNFEGVKRLNLKRDFDLQDVLYNVDILMEAIKKNKQVEFCIAEYDMDKKLKDITPKMVVNPYKLVYKNNVYSLICNIDDCRAVEFYRLDRITKLSLLESAVKSVENVVVNNQSLNSVMLNKDGVLNDNKEEVVLKIEEKYIGKVIDFFGKSVYFKRNENHLEKKNVYAHIVAEVDDILKFALYNDFVELYSPQFLRLELYRMSNQIREKYVRKIDDYDKIAKSVAYFSAINTEQTGLLAKGYNLVLQDIDISTKNSYKYFNCIRRATFENNNIEDFEFLKNYKILSSLTIVNNSVKNLDVLKNNETIERIKIKNTDLDNIEFLETIKNLKYLYFDTYYDYERLDEFFYSKKLRVLVLPKHIINNINVKDLQKNNSKLKIFDTSYSKFDALIDYDYEICSYARIKAEDRYMEIFDYIYEIKPLLEYVNKTLEQKHFFQENKEKIDGLLMEIMNKMQDSIKNLFYDIFYNEVSVTEFCEKNGYNISVFKAIFENLIKSLKNPNISKQLNEFVIDYPL